MSPVGDIVVLTSVVEPEGEMFVSTCIELGTASCGDTIQEHSKTLRRLSPSLEALEELGETERVFHERGIEILRSPIEETILDPFP